MLEKAGLPFRKSPYSVLEEENGLTDAPMFFSIEVEGVTALKAATHSTDLQVPVAPTVNSIEVSSIVFKTSVAGSLLRRVCLFMQRLDSDGKVIGPPVPLAVTDTAQFSVPVKLKLFTGDRVRLLLFQRGTGPAVSAVILSGCILSSADSYFAPGTPPASLLSWTPEPFRSVREPGISASRKRSRSQPRAEQNDSVLDDEPPTLVYAPVCGGDDES
ncbi:conserved hypothetical protein [Leishmania mexicana MHOM/GT/2001/U1103]|uniref:Uncharacterized protein n=1 Tax=Leishmania mexicana (strain MHOM/GT/2001/U1103) TaxID=929439 RepID=E9AQ22_LEIMU|nr:conserved hypothetical protein [Leishmania mexicana MHOM/GT/2001/U1103]CBZ25040.1 conserved hypothetical protein [Leishmania mexicana MHOM/GT/2001/U1103]